MIKKKFITFEGVDCSGKSTQAKILVEKIMKNNKEAFLTREPGGSLGGEQIRELLVKGKKDRWSPETEILLFSAARRDHCEKIIIPKLKKNITVVSDRFHDSTRVYQGIKSEKLKTIVEDLHDLIIPVKPFLTFIIDIDPEIAFQRMEHRGSDERRFEDLGINFQKKVREGFLKLSLSNSKRFVLLNGNRKIDEISDEIFKIYNERCL